MKRWTPRRLRMRITFIIPFPFDEKGIASGVEVV
jgi:hypothetical protein